MNTAPNETPALDPLKRVFVPIEKHGVFRTTDREVYVRLFTGQIVCATPKVRGKAARKADRAQRRLLRRAAQRQGRQAPGA